MTSVVPQENLRQYHIICIGFCNYCCSLKVNYFDNFTLGLFLGKLALQNNKVLDRWKERNASVCKKEIIFNKKWEFLLMKLKYFTANTSHYENGEITMKMICYSASTKIRTSRWSLNSEKIVRLQCFHG